MFISWTMGSRFKVNLNVDIRHVVEYLRAYKYMSVEDWAVDAGYWYDDDHDVWYDDEGCASDIEEELVVMLSRMVR